MTTKYNSTNDAHTLSRDIILEVIRARGESISTSHPDAAAAAKLASFITGLYDTLTAHFEGGDQPR